jgi:hypothetical protein
MGSKGSLGKGSAGGLLVKRGTQVMLAAQYDPLSNPLLSQPE